MKLFAIRDRLLDYFQNPVAFDQAQHVQRNLATTINNPEMVNEITQAPDHFELWQIAEVDDQGHVVEKRELICNCSSLIRNGVWKREQPNGTEAEIATGGSRSPLRPSQRPTDTQRRPFPITPPAQTVASPETDPGPGGGNRHSHG